MADWWESLLNNVGNSVGQVASNPMLIPAVGTAVQSWNNADKYDELGQSFKQEGNPFGQYRQGYGDRLAALYADPSSLANDPGYKFRLSTGAGALASQSQAKNGGWGNEFAAMENYRQGLASTELDNAVKRLAPLAGANIGPEASIQGQIGAANAAVGQRGTALQALGTLLTTRGQTTINNGNGSNGTGGLTGLRPGDLTGNLLNGNAAGVPQIISAIYGGGQGALAAINQAMASGAKFIDLGNGTKIDLEAAARSMGGTDGAGGFPGYPTDGSIGNYGPIAPIPEDPGVVGTLNPGAFNPTDPGVQIEIPEISGPPVSFPEPDFSWWGD